MMRKLKDEFTSWGLKINFAKTGHLTIEKDSADLVSENFKIRKCSKYKNLVNTFLNTANNLQGINIKINKTKSNKYSKSLTME